MRRLPACRRRQNWLISCRKSRTHSSTRSNSSRGGWSRLTTRLQMRAVKPLASLPPSQSYPLTKHPPNLKPRRSSPSKSTYAGSSSMLKLRMTFARRRKSGYRAATAHRAPLSQT
jgi:hypothetical protein